MLQRGIKKQVRKIDPNKAFAEAKRDWEETRLNTIAIVYVTAAIYGRFTKTAIAHGALLFTHSYLKNKTGRELALPLPTEDPEKLKKLASDVSNGVTLSFFAACVYKMY